MANRSEAKLPVCACFSCRCAVDIEHVSDCERETILLQNQECKQLIISSKGNQVVSQCNSSCIAEFHCRHCPTAVQCEGDWVDIHIITLDSNKAICDIRNILIIAISQIGQGVAIDTSVQRRTTPFIQLSLCTYEEEVIKSYKTLYPVMPESSCLIV